MLACALAFFLAVPGPALLALRAPVIAIAAAQVAAGVAIGFFVAVWQTTLQQHVPEEAFLARERLGSMGSFAFMPLGFVLAGPVFDQIGISTTLWIGVVWCASTAVVAALPEIRNVRRIDAPRTAAVRADSRPGRGRRSTGALDLSTPIPSPDDVRRARKPSRAACIGRPCSPRRPSGLAST